MMRVLDLFSGVGGFSLGLERTNGFRTVAFCEIEPFPRKVLAKHWPEVPCYDDVRTLTATRLAADGIGVDVITGGFPCQDISTAGRLAGIGAQRSGLWSEIVRLARELRPRVILVENVANLLAGPSEQPGRWFGRVLGDLAECGFDAEWRIIRAADVGLPHFRERVWIAAYPIGTGRQGRFKYLGAPAFSSAASAFGRHAAADARAALESGCRGLRDDDGLSVTMVRNRIKCLGNAVVPQVVTLIGNAILAAEASMSEAA